MFWALLLKYRKQAGSVLGVTIEVPKSVSAAESRGKSAPSALRSSVGGTPYTDIARRSGGSRDRYD